MAILYIDDEKYRIFKPGTNVQYYLRTNELLEYKRREGTIENVSIIIEDNVSIRYRICGECKLYDSNVVFNITEEDAECILTMDDYRKECNKLGKDTRELQRTYNRKLRALGVINDSGETD